MISLGPQAGTTSGIYFASASLLRHEVRFHHLFLISLILKTEPPGQFLLLSGARTWFSCSHTFSLIFYFQWFPSLPQLVCSGIHPAVQAGLKLSDLPYFCLLSTGIKVMCYHSWLTFISWHYLLSIFSFLDYLTIIFFARVQMTTPFIFYFFFRFIYLF